MLCTVKFEIGFSSRTINGFILTHISMYTSPTVLASYILDPALAYDPCSGGVACEMWTTA
jgi:hypothetical protein